MIKRGLIKNPIYLTAAIVLVAIVALGLFLRFHKNKDIIPSTNPTPPAADSNSGAVNQQPSSSSGPASSNSDKNPASVATPSGTDLAAPYGTFVSDHHPSLSGANNTPSSELSTCTTTPGASCYITFAKDGVTKKLASQTTDGSGSTSWHWDVSQAGLSEGTWEVTAVASLGGQTKTTIDTFKLEVQP